MKSLFFILAILPLSVFSQSISLKGGVSVSHINAPDSKQLVGPNFGIIYTRTLNQFQISIEPSFNQKGYSYDIIFTDINGSPLRSERVRTKLNYLDIPITFGWVPVNDKWIFGIHSGFTPAILLSANYKSASSSGSFNDTRPINLDFILGAKGGIKFNEHIFLALNVRYGVGLISIFESTANKYRYFSSFMEVGYKF